MQRRLFMTALSAAPLAWSVNPARGAIEAPQVKVLTTHVANCDPQAPPPAGSRYRLVRESRAFDPLGVALVGPTGERYGYVPPARASILAALLDQGADGYAEPSPGMAGKVDVFLWRSTVVEP